MINFPKKYKDSQLKTFAKQYDQIITDKKVSYSVFPIPTSHPLNEGNFYSFFMQDFLQKRDPKLNAEMQFLFTTNKIALIQQAQQFFMKKKQPLEKLGVDKLNLFIASQERKKTKTNLKILDTYLGINDVQQTNQPSFLSFHQSLLDKIKTSNYIKSKSTVVYQSFKMRAQIYPKDIIWKEETKNIYTLTYFVETKNHTLHIPVIEPDSIFGDVALLVHPQDKRYKKLIGKHVLIPIINKAIPILGDDTVNISKSNGIKRVTPSIDEESVFLAQKHKLSLDQFIYDQEGKYTELTGMFQGQNRDDFLDNVIQTLEDFLHFVQHKDIQEIKIQVPYCRYNDEELHPLLVNQQSIDVDSAKLALQAELEDDEFLKSIKNELLNLLPNTEIIFSDSDFLPGEYNLYLHSLKKDILPVAFLEKDRYDRFLQEILLQYIILGKFIHNQAIVYPSRLDKKGERFSCFSLQNKDFFDNINSFGLNATRLAVIIQGEISQDLLRMYDTLLRQLRNGVRYWRFQDLKANFTEKEAIQKVSKKGNEADFRILSELDDLRTEYQSLTDYTFIKFFFPKLHLFIQNKFLSRYLELQKSEGSEARLDAIFLVIQKLLIMLYPLLPQYTKALSYVSGISIKNTNFPLEIKKKNSQSVILYKIFEQISTFKQSLNIQKHQHISIFLKADTHSLEEFKNHQAIFESLLKIDNINLIRMHENEPNGYQLFSRDVFTIGIKNEKTNLKEKLSIDDLKDEYQSLLEQKEVIRIYIMQSHNLGITSSPQLDIKQEQLAEIQLKISKIQTKLGLT
ncbi:hypothetical protein AGMMS50249_2670 [candidate division SR1 bacterium]|nr:hypothetical protein AGMMS50249_2670 [candidate division SR1 bacterium]